ncbi:hypothetical protein FKP32DRAFT_1593734 [Trametes sanguinea]|nr:hypothetical protein FKP32DRAFT_1598459 [Trametes sanguinea]KAI9058423.1 hypothetical protein FKP32DRAFT_1597516 [Trametes sanguinea]KAI9061645.1 hypothetical protein FKP32DRAFT_1594440 [Trametes sanguinea]KAI9062163.1 hypothetical protein FKP32DRAFT_1593734 [Trametes sanguinea]
MCVDAQLFPDVGWKNLHGPSCFKPSAAVTFADRVEFLGDILANMRAKGPRYASIQVTSLYSRPLMPLYGMSE